jgi:hypothetical protein
VGVTQQERVGAVRVRDVLGDQAAPTDVERAAGARIWIDNRVT